MVLEFYSDAYPYFLTVAGIIGFFLGFDRITEEEEKENKPLQVAGVLAGLVVITSIVLAIINSTEITKYTILFGILFGVSLLAKPMRKVHTAFAISALVGSGLTFWVLYSRNKDKGNESFFNSIALKWVFLAIFLIVLVVFIISFIQEQTMDIMLFFLGLGIIIFPLSLIIFLQGITLILNLPNSDGILGYLPG